jgi:hypothetical protein
MDSRALALLLFCAVAACQNEVSESSPLPLRKAPPSRHVASTSPPPLEEHVTELGAMPVDAGADAPERCRFAVWNGMDASSDVALSSDLLTATSSAGTSAVRADHTVSSGRHYWEVLVVSFGSSRSSIGVGNDGADVASSDTCSWSSAGFLTCTNAFAGRYRAGDVIGVAVDADQKRVWFRRNGTWLFGDPAQNIGGATLSGSAFHPRVEVSYGDVFIANFGMQPLRDAPPPHFAAGVCS